MFRSRALLAKDKPAKFLAEGFYFGRIAGGPESLRKLEERVLSLCCRREPLFNKFKQHSVIAETALAGNRTYALVDFGRKCDASPHRFCPRSCFSRHGISLHHSGASSINPTAER